MQSKRQSFIEAIINITVGYGLAVLTQMIVFPLYGYSIPLAQNLQMGLVFTIVSLIRTYFLRRVFNRFALNN